MLHKMKLQEDPFERIKNGTKTVEFRLYDEKRQTIQIGDEIEFSKLPELQEKLLVKVIDLYKEKSFEKLFKKVFVGEDEEKIIEKAKSMNRFYAPEQEENNKDMAKERLHLVLMQDRANVSADFLEMMKQEIIDVIKNGEYSVNLINEN